LSQTTQNLLRKAVELLGEEELAATLKVPRHLLQAWMSGHASMPDRKLMLLIDALDKLAGK
jgi:DNA-binding transcriptional regulator YiaG